MFVLPIFSLYRMEARGIELIHNKAYAIEDEAVVVTEDAPFSNSSRCNSLTRVCFVHHMWGRYQ